MRPIVPSINEMIKLQCCRYYLVWVVNNSRYYGSAIDNSTCTSSLLYHIYTIEYELLYFVIIFPNWINQLQHN